MANPKRSVELLNQLETLGFTDEAFALLHHSRVRGRRDTIVSHRSYCEKHSLFQRDGDNERTQRRLEFVLRRYLHGGGSDCRSDIFVELANRAFGEIPPGKIVGKRATAELISHEHRSRRQTSRSIEAPRAHFETRCSFDRQTNSVTDTELEGLWREYARRFSQEHIKNELKRSWPNDLNIVQDRIEFSYPPTFQPGYVGPLFSTSRRRILFLAYNPGVGQNNREGDKELSERLKTFATGKLRSPISTAFWLAIL